MRLLFLIGGLSLQDGGTAIEIVRLSEMLIKEKGVKVTVGCLTPKYESIRLNDEVRYVQFDGFKRSITSAFKEIHKLKMLIREHDIIFLTGIWGPIDGLACRLAWKQNKPTYIRICGMLEPYILERNILKKRLGLILYVRKNLKKVNGIIVNSDLETRNVLKQGIAKSKILVIPNSIMLSDQLNNKIESKKSFGINPNNKVLLYLGRLHQKKGLHYLLKAIAMIPKDQRRFNLIVAGEFSDDLYRTEITKIIDDFELKELILFTGLVSGKEKENHFNAADCFVLPSKSEGLPNAVLEALAHGLPAIITKGCNLPEIEDYKAGLVIELSIPALVNALNWFLFKIQSQTNFSENAKKLISERFTPEKCIEQYKAVIYSHM